MPLRLKQLDLHGYKTFATKSEFTFSEGISAIVGPNGSGKSNVVDSIRWVLGEQSFGLLRGKKTEDMIFAGSELRPRAGMAQATLTFDNSDGWLPIDFTEVAIARRAYRDGENEYLLNGQRVRLRDIGELLAKCGLAERTYTIIGQGLIDTALSLKAEERRALFEEAAGIGVYRNKREDALRKLDATQRNLERVLDILAEIKPRLRSLERQAQRARDFNQVRDDLHALLKLWYGYHWHRAVEELEQARVTADRTATELAQHQSQQDNFDQAITELRAHIAAWRGQLNTLRQSANQLRTEGEALARQVAVADERLRSLAAQRDSLTAELPPLEAQLAGQAKRALEAQSEVTRLTAEAEEARQQAGAAQTALADHEAHVAQLRARETEARRALTQIESQINQRTAQHAQLSEHQSKLAIAQADQQAALTQSQNAEAGARAKVVEATVALTALQTARAEAEARVAARVDEVRSAESALLTATQVVAEARTETERLRARQEVLEQARAELVGFSAGAKTLLAQNFPARGALAELLTVPAELETAVSAALGHHLEALVVNDRAEVEAAIRALGAANGRATLLPLQSLTAPEPLTPPADPDCLGVAAHLITTDDSFRPIIHLLLGHTLIVRNREAAQRLLQSRVSTTNSLISNSLILVTLTGEVYHASGPVLAGSDPTPGVLQRARERRDLSAEVETAQTRIAHCEHERGVAERAVTSAREALTQAQAGLKDAQSNDRRAMVARDALALEAERLAHEAQFRREQLTALEAEAKQLTAETGAAHTALNQLANEQAEAQARVLSATESLTQFTTEEAATQLARWQTALAVARRAAQDAQTRATELARAHTAAESLVADRRQKIARLETEAHAVTESVAEARQREAALQSHIANLQSQISPLETQLAGQETKQAHLESSDAESRAALHAAERRNTQAQLDFTRKNEELEGMRRRVEEDFGLVELDYGGENSAATGPTPLPLYPLVEKLERLESLPDELEEQLNRKRGQLRRMGLINPEAEKEFNEVKERYEFLTTQVGDLQTAQTQLREVIAEMDVLMERDFRKTFDAVANEFKDTFARLFGGGTARLILTDPEHLTTSGVDIQARLPGKRPQTLSMLSGGERSLTACALVFALLRVSPTPFCVLDEVDAMLDEANVGRYRDMLSDLAQTTQFIIVTHNRNTVQVADTVYGITMGNDSTSQVIGLKLDGEKVGEARPMSGKEIRS